MNKEEHRQTHIKLHESLDILVADMITEAKIMPSQTTVMELMQWSAQQCKERHEPTS